MALIFIMLITFILCQILFSASDDRSIRAMKCNLCSEYSRDESVKTCVVYGHEGRIWAIKSHYQG